MSEKKVLPLLPLRGLTVFPMMVLHLDVGREKSVQALEQAMIDDDNLILLAAQKEMHIEDPTPQDIYNVGTVTRIKQMLKFPNGAVRVLVEGLYRGKVVDFVESKSCFQVEIEDIQNTLVESPKVDALARSVLAYFEQYCTLSHRIPDETYTIVADIEDPGHLSDIVASHLPLKLVQKQKILETSDIKKRLEKLLGILNNESEILELEQKIVSRVKGQMEKAQKEYYLREQIKAIHRELGEKEGNLSDCERFRTRLKKLKASSEVKSKIASEIDRLERTSSNSAESGVIRSYVECLLDLPWNIDSKSEFSISEAEKVLADDHYGLEKTKERIIEHLAVQKMSGNIKAPILCLVGPPGVGKTSIVKSIARALNREFVRISLGGLRDESEIRGHRRTYVGAMPGRVIQSLKSAGTSNPLILLDEIDKMTSDFRGDPEAALLEVLDPNQNTKFVDHYVDMPFDVSRVMFIATANSLHNISRPLLDRMEIITISGYTEFEKEQIAKSYLIPRQLQEHNLTTKDLQIYSTSIVQLIRNYTSEAGVRGLERAISTLCRKAVKRILGGYKRKIVITPQNLERFLGKEKYRYGKSEEKDQVGVATGLAWTEHGGDTLPVESAICAGKGVLTLTGQLGDVMQESAKAAFSYIRSRASELDISPNFNEDNDIHIHFPEGAIPKDGPSAGIAIATALISALTNIPISCRVAMTGEITLRGRVLAIGGLKEKVLGAHRAGITHIIYPKMNEADLEDIPASVRDGLVFHAVNHMDEVLQIALVRDPRASLTV